MSREKVLWCETREVAPHVMPDHLDDPQPRLRILFTVSLVISRSRKGTKQHGCVGCPGYQRIDEFRERLASLARLLEALSSG